jgi:type I restriction enzyme S subunit
LQYAIQGKLVPQDPADEPAFVLLDRIRVEKELLIKQGKIKRDKNERYIYKSDDNSYYEKIGEKIVCIDDELPFEIPQSWTWVKINDVFLVNPRNIAADTCEASFIPMPMISDGFNNTHSYEKRLWGNIKSGFTHFRDNDIGIAKITPCFENRKSVVFSNLINGIGAGTTELHILRTIGSNMILSEYALWFVKTALFIDGGKEHFTGTAGQQRVGKEYIENMFFPLPPLAEQRRIITEIDSVFQGLNLL